MLQVPDHLIMGDSMTFDPKEDKGKKLDSIARTSICTMALPPEPELQG